MAVSADWANSLRRAKYFAIGLAGRAKILGRRLGKPSPKGSIVLLSLGGGKGSPYVASAVAALGYDLYVLSAEFPRLESPFARGWIKADPFGNYDDLKAAVSAHAPVAVLVEQRNILLPIKSRLVKDLGLLPYGEESFRTSNSKIAMREAIDRAGLPNPPWMLLDAYQPSAMPFPFVLKPEKGTGSRGITIIYSKADFASAREKLDALAEDETVGGRAFLEAMIPGRQFDVEGIYRNGECFPLSLTEEHYDRVEGALPSSWYLFAPPIDPALEKKLFDAAKAFTKALGVINGAFHIEMRVDPDLNIYAIDYSNRMGYPHLVSECCGLSFPQAYVLAMTGSPSDLRNVQKNTVFQRYIRHASELEPYRALVSKYPDLVIQKNMWPFIMGGVLMHARVALRASDFGRITSVLGEFGLIPEEWRSYYNL